jgi:hypothetical protein
MKGAKGKMTFWTQAIVLHSNSTTYKRQVAQQKLKGRVISTIGTATIYTGYAPQVSTGPLKTKLAPRVSTGPLKTKAPNTQAFPAPKATGNVNPSSAKTMVSKKPISLAKPAQNNTKSKAATSSPSAKANTASAKPQKDNKSKAPSAVPAQAAKAPSVSAPHWYTFSPEKKYRSTSSGNPMPWFETNAWPVEAYGTEEEDLQFMKEISSKTRLV